MNPFQEKHVFVKVTAKCFDKYRMNELHIKYILQLFPNKVNGYPIAFKIYVNVV